MKILMSIVSHNQQDLVQKLLHSLDKFGRSSMHEVVVILTENSRVENDATCRNFKLLKTNNLRPKGFGANHNAAFEKEVSDFFLIVNPDILIDEYFDFDFLVEYLNQKLIDVGSPNIINVNGTLEDFKRADLTFLNLVKRKIFREKREDFDWFAGMFLVVRSDCFRELGGFDTDFFMYVEDCDFCMRARAAGMQLNELVDFTLVHDARRASRKNFKHLRWHLSSLTKYWIYKKIKFLWS